MLESLDISIEVDILKLAQPYLSKATHYWSSVRFERKRSLISNNIASKSMLKAPLQREECTPDVDIMDN